MAATSTRVQFITNQWRKSVSLTSSAQTRHGALARESTDPVETALDSITDAQTMADARQALLSPERRRFQAKVTGLTEVLALAYIGAVPVARYRDTERTADMKMLVSEIVIDLEIETASLLLWG